MQNKMNYIKSLFRDKNYFLTEEDIKNIKMQIERKPILIYIKSINYLEDKKIEITYDNVKLFIKCNIKIRDLVKKITSGIEESFRVSMIGDDYSNEKYEEIKNKRFCDLIQNSKINNNDKQILNNIRRLRNNVSHLSYPIIEEQINFIIQVLLKSKEIHFIKNSTIDFIVDEIKKIYLVNFQTSL